MNDLDDNRKTCPTCEGKGYPPEGHETGDGGQCTECNGSGQVVADQGYEYFLQDEAMRFEKHHPR